MKQFIESAIVILIAIGVAAGIALACSQNGAMVFDGFPLFAFCVIMAFVINWLSFIPAFIFQTEKFFDLTGSITYSIFSDPITSDMRSDWLSPNPLHITDTF